MNINIRILFFLLPLPQTGPLLAKAAFVTKGFKGLGGGNYNNNWSWRDGHNYQNCNFSSGLQQIDLKAEFWLDHTKCTSVLTAKGYAHSIFHLKYSVESE